MAKCHHDFAAQMEAIDDGECPLCLKDAAAGLEQRLKEQKALTENAWKVANDQARQREDLEGQLKTQATSIKTYQQVCARLEEEKAQAEIANRQADETSMMLQERLAQAEARELAMPSV